MGNPLAGFGNTLAEPPVKLTLREKIELGIEKSGVGFSTAYDAEKLADAIMEVFQPPKPVTVVVVPDFNTSKVKGVEITVTPTEGV